MNPPPLPTSAPQRLRMNLAIGCLMLGGFGIFPSVGYLMAATDFLGLFAIFGFVAGLLGLAFSLPALVLGAAHLRRRTKRNGMVWAGIIFSLVGVGTSVASGIAVYNYFTSPEFVETWQRQPTPITSNEFANLQGVVAPDFSVTTTDGRALKISDLKGKRVVVNFWTTWDPPCLRQVPPLVQLRKETSANQLVIVGVSTEDMNTLKSFASESGINYPIAAAENLPSPYRDVSERPTSFFLDRNGVIQSVLVGYQDFETLKTNALAADFVGKSKPAPR
jgi:cytochrome c biogenesis protein CcmG/thiol:disulfide interchange protein DsbE